MIDMSVGKKSKIALDSILGRMVGSNPPPLVSSHPA